MSRLLFRDLLGNELNIVIEVYDEFRTENVSFKNLWPSTILGLFLIPELKDSVLKNF